ncbi:MAG: histidine kinase, partial [candidate division KSB1 bacterium]|nr:histidine kinase [candidate division KSB1 bacterium]
SIHFLFAILCSALWLFLSYGSWYLAEGERIFERVDVRGIIGWQFLFGMIQYFFVAGIFYTIIYHRNLKQKEIEEAELKILTRDAELKALKLQMNPHFLFNTLNSINALVTKEPASARKMIAQLSDLLRMSLETHDKLMIPLKEELELVHTYLAIEQMRFGDKMIFKEDIDPDLLTKPFPAMLLQPLLENAVKHGIASTRTGGTISLSIRRIDDQIVGTVINETGGDRSSKPATSASNGISLTNIRQRLDRMYGANYAWQIDQSEANKFKVEFKLPLQN